MCRITEPQLFLGKGFFDGQHTAFARGAEVEIWLEHNLWHLRQEKRIQKRPFTSLMADLDAFRKQFPGWWFGFISYELKNRLEKGLISSNTKVFCSPELYFFIPKTLDFSPELPHSQSESFVLGDLHSRSTQSDYLNAVQAIKHRIYEGDTYEINLTRCVECDFHGDSLALFHAMLSVGDVPFSAWGQFSFGDVCSCSPERYLSKRGQRIKSEPIKGTRPRGKTPEEDQNLISELANSEKDKAENLMITDLVRHDLSRTCLPGSVRVEHLFDVRTFPQAHQLVTTVSGQLRNETSLFESLLIPFPMGSMTGAPKIRSMRLIDYHENYARGLYSGSIGWISPGNDFDFNVVIRTALIQREKLYFPVGGAITADSCPQDEWEETQIKLQPLSRLTSPIQHT